METIIDKYAALSKEIYSLCTKKEMIRRKCLNLGRMECDLLQFLSTANQPVCMNDLSEEMKVSHSRITRIIDTLVRKKLVRRFPSKKDRRSWLTQITEKGIKANKQTMTEFVSMQQNLISRLPESDLETIYDTIHKYITEYQAVLTAKEATL